MELKLKPRPFYNGRGRVRKLKMDRESYARSAVRRLTMRLFSRGMTINLLLNVRQKKRGTYVIEWIMLCMVFGANSISE